MILRRIRLVYRFLFYTHVKLKNCENDELYVFLRPHPYIYIYIYIYIVLFFFRNRKKGGGSKGAAYIGGYQGIREVRLESVAGGGGNCAGLSEGSPAVSQYMIFISTISGFIKL